MSDQNRNAPAPGSAEYYLLQMLERLKDLGEYRVRWEWAIRHMTDWKECAESLGSPHYILEPELRSAKFRDALKAYENLARTNDPGSMVMSCGTCGGSGMVAVAMIGDTTGDLIGEKCERCDGKGVVLK